MNHFDKESNLPETENLHIHLAISPAKEKGGSSAMALPPDTTPAPQPFTPGMSSQDDAPAPTSSAVPAQPNGKPTSEETKPEDKEPDSSSPTAFKPPRLRLHVQEIGHPGASIFLTSVNAATILQQSIKAIHKHLYTGPITPSSTSSPQSTHLHPPPTRSVTLILRPMDGVAYTTGSDLDSDHKEIHFSLRYISGISPSSRYSSEITGVVVHELVHCYQWNGSGTAPGGLIEGVADWVRLQSNLAPPHWDRGAVPGRWDVGYQGTAYFLEYLEGRFGEGVVRRLNEKLRKERYEEVAFWTELVGWPVERLFEDYKKTLEEKSKE